VIWKSFQAVGSKSASSLKVRIKLYQDSDQLDWVFIFFFSDDTTAPDGFSRECNAGRV
jgi:hypothetical protein